ncbi:hypothetical protein K3552_01760 [Leisingera aquaemixtae]|uniref:hypothetical protein n=1 Tax=Leisingera aquaemixtae TaxID=1396826 RepID=UPI0021A31A67|nr:hypothetical protein [Leisingera aquaemixtae]UWQ37758.1 hypothetical protein K3552_01760 [Leisingera aquaemixtae]
MSTSIVHFHEMRIKKSDLSHLSDEETAVFGMLSYICNELNVFSRLLRLSGEKENDGAPVRFARDLQHHVVLRTLSSRLFEAYEFISEVGKKARGINSDIFSLFQRSATEIEKLGASNSRSINRNIRNETSFHYKYRDALKNAKSLPEDADASIYLNELDGNTYFVLGESMMFFERLRRFSKADKKFENPELLAEEWLSWSLDIVRLVKKLLADVFEIVLDRLDTKIRKTHYYVKRGMVAESDSAFAPVFLRSAQ